MNSLTPFLKNALKRTLSIWRLCLNVRHISVEVLYFPNTLQVLTRQGGMENVILASSSNWIMSFQRDHSAESSMEILDMAKPFKDEIIAVGLDNYEVHNFALKFEDVFRRAREEGYHLTSHCDCNQQNSIETYPPVSGTVTGGAYRSWAACYRQPGINVNSTGAPDSPHNVSYLAGLQTLLPGG